MLFSNSHTDFSWCTCDEGQISLLSAFEPLYFPLLSLMICKTKSHGEKLPVRKKGENHLFYVTITK